MKNRNPNPSPLEFLISAFLTAVIVLVLSITFIGMVSDHITSKEHHQQEQNK